MKKTVIKAVSLVTIGAMAVSLAGCSVVVTKQPKAGETYTGTVDSIDEDYIFIMTEDDESYRIELSEETAYAYESGSADSGDMSGGDSGSGRPSGDMPSGGGDSSGGGDMPSGGEAPSGDMSNGGGEAPDTDASADDGSEASDGAREDSESNDDASADSTSADAMAYEVTTSDSDNAAGGDAPSGDMSNGGGGEAPSGDMSNSSGGEAPSGGTSDNSSGGEAPSGGMPDNSGGGAPSGGTSDNSGDEAPSGGTSDNNGGGAPSGDMPSGGGDDSSDDDSGDDSSDDDSGDDSSDDGSDDDSSGDVSDEDMVDDDAMAVDPEEDSGMTYEDVAEGDTVTVVVNDEREAESVTITSSDSDGDSDTADSGESGDANGGMGGGEAPSGGMGGGSDSSAVSYTAVNEYTEDTTVSGETIESAGTDENAVLLSTSDVTVTLDDVTILRDSSDSTGGDDSSFYGVGASALVTSGTLKVLNSTITSDAAGGAGVFAYGDGVAYVSDTTITTQQGTSGGIHVAGGGTLYAWNLDVTTAGGSSAAIRSDRGSGTMVVDGGTYTSNGTGSPAIYCAADVTVNESTLTATASEAICIEGLNSIRLFDCDLSGSMADDSQNDCTWNIILYQSTSGDAEEGNSTFEMVGGTLTAENGGMFYTTNTESTFIISDVDITYAEDSEFLFKCTGNSNQRGWGSSGSNGADSNFTAIDQELAGDVIWDTISQMDFYLTDGSSLTGAVLNDESQAGSGGSGYANVYIDETSTWVVTGDSTLTALYNEGTITDTDGNTVTITGSDGTEYVSGTSEYTITVDSYEESADLSGASTLDSWSDFEVSQE